MPRLVPSWVYLMPLLRRIVLPLSQKQSVCAQIHDFSETGCSCHYFVLLLHIPCLCNKLPGWPCWSLDVLCAPSSSITRKGYLCCQPLPLPTHHVETRTRGESDRLPRNEWISVCPFPNALPWAEHYTLTQNLRWLVHTFDPALLFIQCLKSLT